MRSAVTNIRVSLGTCALLLQLLLLDACALPGTPSSSMPALEQMCKVPLRMPGDLADIAMTLGVLPANLLLRMNKGGTVEPLPGIKPIVAWPWITDALLSWYWRHTS